MDIGYFPEYSFWSALFREYRLENSRSNAVPNRTPEGPAGAKHYRTEAIRCAVHRNLDLSLENFGKALRIDSADSRGYELRGCVRAVRKEWKDALADFSRAIDLTPDNPSLYNYRAKVYKESGDSMKHDSDMETYNRKSKEKFPPFLEGRKRKK